MACLDWRYQLAYPGKIDMHFLLYLIAVFSAVIGAVWGAKAGSMSIVSSGVMAAVLFGSFGRIIHLLVQIEAHLSAAGKRKE
jgi:hypothetical protein